MSEARSCEREWLMSSVARSAIKAFSGFSTTLPASYRPKMNRERKAVYVTVSPRPTVLN
jgi:hypothetical protein